MQPLQSRTHFRILTLGHRSLAPWVGGQNYTRKCILEYRFPFVYREVLYCCNETVKDIPFNSVNVLSIGQTLSEVAPVPL